MILLNIAFDTYERVPASAIDAAAPFIAVAGLAVFIMLGVLGIREAPRGRKR